LRAPAPGRRLSTVKPPLCDSPPASLCCRTRLLAG
jgi:hypothetical protein